MPPKLKLSNHANVSSEFVDLMCEIYESWAQLHMVQIQDGARNPRNKHFTQTAARMMPIVRRQSPAPRAGLDYEITRLQTLPFTEFLVVCGPHPDEDVHETIRWLVGRTRHITATYYNARHQIAGELGRYDIYITEIMAKQPDLYQLHMIPQRNQKAIARHYHHGIQTDEVTRIPLNYPTQNCWGDYTVPLKGLMDEPDIPELFRQLRNHLATYGDRPPFRELDFDTTTPERP
jgi:hypothetical protein